MPEFQFDSVGDFLAMGGDALFVWSSYILFGVFIGWNLIQPRLMRRNTIRLLRARMQREQTMQTQASTRTE